MHVVHVHLYVFPTFMVQLEVMLEIYTDKGYNLSDSSFSRHSARSDHHRWSAVGKMKFSNSRLLSICFRLTSPDYVNTPLTSLIASITKGIPNIHIVFKFIIGNGEWRADLPPVTQILHPLLLTQDIQEIKHHPTAILIGW